MARVPLTLERDGGCFVAGQADFFERFGEAFLNEAGAFVAAVRSGGPSPLTLEDAREATRLACAMRAALKVRQNGLRFGRAPLRQVGRIFNS